MMRTDDPVFDAERHTAEQESKLHKLPKCADCGNPIQDDYLFEICGEKICEECLIEHYRKSVDLYVG